MRLALPYGTRPYVADLPDTVRNVEILEAGELPPPPPTPQLLRAALAAPINASLRVRPGDRVTLIVSDATRHEPRAAFIEALREHLPDVRYTLAIATGTHGPARIADLDIPAALLDSMTLVNHDGHNPNNLVDLGTTSRGTPVRVHRCLVDTDLVIATGCIRPHYFAGFGAGSKALFPGLGEAGAIRTNHLLKTAPSSRAGIVDGNECRDDLEEAARKLPTPSFLLDGVCGPDDEIHAAVAGDLFAAFRAGVATARPWFTVRATPAPLVIASDALPVTASLYQAAKIAAAAAPLVAPGGTLVVVAQCPDGIGPLATVNEAIFRIGILPRLAPNVRLVLVSDIPAFEASQTLLEPAPSLAAALTSHPAETTRILILPRASHLLAEAIP